MSHPKFEQVDIRKIPELLIEAQTFKHIETGAKHIHLSTDDYDNGFLVAIRTPPFDNSGVFHILEHTVLCGSKKFPIKSPLQVMANQSVSTFMNAFTGPDWTAFVFCSHNKKDFKNLLEVYLDSVFHARLTPLDFAQEGHRLEFSSLNDQQSPLIRKGVVLNEMKGAMSDPFDSHWEVIKSFLFENSPYTFNSGGEPNEIIHLTHEALLETYNKYYHPSNAVFFTYGSIPAIQHQQWLEELLLSRFNFQKPISPALPQIRYSKPIKKSIGNYLSNTTPSKNNTVSVSFSWLLGDSSSLTDILQAELISYLLLDARDAPVKSLIEKSTHITNLSELSGMDSACRDTIFVIAFDEVNPNDIELLEKDLFNEISEFKNKTFEATSIARALSHIEIERRSIDDAFLPVGVTVMMDMLPSSLYDDSSPLVSDTNYAIKELYQKSLNGNFIQSLLEKMILNNNHRLRLSYQHSENILKEDLKNLQLIKASLSESQKKYILDYPEKVKSYEMLFSKTLIELPKITINDLIKNTPLLASKEIIDDPITLNIGRTNGLVYQQVIIDASKLPLQLQEILKLYSSYLQFFYHSSSLNQVSSACSLDISTSIKVFPNLNKDDGVCIYFVLSGKALERDYKELDNNLDSYFFSAEFKFNEKIQSYLRHAQYEIELNLIQGAHMHTLSAASTVFSHKEHLSHNWYGFSAYRRIKNLNTETCETSNKLKDLIVKFKEIHDFLTEKNNNVHLIASEQFIDKVDLKYYKHWRKNPVTHDKKVSNYQYQCFNQPTSKLWIHPVPVQFCAKVFPTVGVKHPDFTPLLVLGKVLQNGFLNQAIREKEAAYGSGASQEWSVSSFRFYSYRDPRFTDTLNDFDRSIEWFLNEKYDKSILEDAKLRAFVDWSQTSTAIPTLQNIFIEQRAGLSHSVKKNIQSKIESITLEDLKRVVTTYLKPSKGYISVLGGNTIKKEAKLHKFETEEL
ncbi:insulinase family protein [Pleionea mediterranea]|uniref:insulinase family protein n=1 Tax=Pleionea mediterranea TaxID=523701 RepID=UPI0011B2448F|nr:insulinase family protein [Pleionea mediterranea]